MMGLTAMGVWATAAIVCGFVPPGPTVHWGMNSKFGGGYELGPSPWALVLTIALLG